MTQIEGDLGGSRREDEDMTKTDDAVSRAISFGLYGTIYGDTTLADVEANGTYPFDKFETFIAANLNALPLVVGAEVIGTGGGCTAIVAEDGTTEVVLTMEDGDYMLCVYRTNDKSPERSAWYPEQMLDTDGVFSPDHDADFIIGVFAGLVEAFVTCDEPFVVKAEKNDALVLPTETYIYHQTQYERFLGSAEEALDIASDLAYWVGNIDRVTVEDCRTGRDLVLHFDTQLDALSAFETSIGR